MVGLLDPKLGNLQKKIKRAWIKAFFDDEATVDRKLKRIIIKSMNLNGLKFVRRLLFDIGVKSHITGQNIDKSWYLTINNLEVKKFASKIDLNHTKKKLLLKETAESIIR